MFWSALPVYLLVLIAETTSASLLPRSVENAHRIAVKHSSGLARDLRLAFGGVLLAPPNKRSLEKRAEFCKAGLSRANSNSGGANGGSTGGATSGSPTGGKNSTSSGSKSASAGSPASTGVAASPWKLIESHQGSNFYDGWDFFTAADPTHGIVDYVDQATGRSSGILSVNSAGNAIMRIETTPTVAQNRKSIRITTQSHINGGLVLMDAVHMPSGCGTWPAFWSNGPNWPAGGEIDIVEGVGDYTHNQATIHTNPGCTIPTSDAGKLDISGTVIGGTDCAAASTGNQGCGIRAAEDNSYGASFNAAGGGVYAMLWDNTGIAVYFWSRNAIPADVSAGAPRPDSWGAALARWPATNCDPFKFFKDHSLIFDTTLCGDWAGGVWGASGIPGQEQSCAQRTGFSTCEAFVRANGGSFGEAYWEVKYVKTFQLK